MDYRPQLWKTTEGTSFCHNALCIRGADFYPDYRYDLKREKVCRSVVWYKKFSTNQFRYSVQLNIWDWFLISTRNGASTNIWYHHILISFLDVLGTAIGYLHNFFSTDTHTEEIGTGFSTEHYRLRYKYWVFRTILLPKPKKNTCKNEFKLIVPYQKTLLVPTANLISFCDVPNVGLYCTVHH